jgi:hypothetical protein
MLSLIKDNLCTNANVINNYTVEKYKCKISPKWQVSLLLNDNTDKKFSVMKFISLKPCYYSKSLVLLIQ